MTAHKMDIIVLSEINIDPLEKDLFNIKGFNFECETPREEEKGRRTGNIY